MFFVVFTFYISFFPCSFKYYHAGCCQLFSDVFISILFLFPYVSGKNEILKRYFLGFKTKYSIFGIIMICLITFLTNLLMRKKFSLNLNSKTTMSYFYFFVYAKYTFLKNLTPNPVMSLLNTILFIWIANVKWFCYPWL